MSQIAEFPFFPAKQTSEFGQKKQRRNFLIFWGEGGLLTTWQLKLLSGNAGEFSIISNPVETKTDLSMVSVKIPQLRTLFHCEPCNDDLLMTPTQLASVPDACEHVCAFSFPHSEWTLAWWDVFSQSQASQMNGLWPTEVSLVDLGVTPTQWWTELLEEEQKRRPPGSEPIVVGGAKTWQTIKKREVPHLSSNIIFKTGRFCFYWCRTGNRSVQLQQYAVFFVQLYVELYNWPNKKKFWSSFLHMLMLVRTFLNIIFAWEVEREDGGGAARWAESFYLTPWDDVKSPTSRPPPTPSSLPYAEELALCGGLGSWLSAHTCTRCPPFSSSKMENNRYFCFGGTTQDGARAPMWTTSPVKGDSRISK